MVINGDTNDCCRGEPIISRGHFFRPTKTQYPGGEIKRERERERERERVNRKATIKIVSTSPKGIPPPVLGVVRGCMRVVGVGRVRECVGWC